MRTDRRTPIVKGNKKTWQSGNKVAVEMQQISSREEKNPSLDRRPELSVGEMKARGGLVRFETCWHRKLPFAPRVARLEMKEKQLGVIGGGSEERPTGAMLPDRQGPGSHLKAAQMITEPQGLDDHGRSLSQRGVTERTGFFTTH